MTSEKFSLKDQLFNKQKITQLAKRIGDVHSSFSQKDFTHDVIVAFPHLELKQRIVHIREQLKKYLPYSYRKTVGILLNSLPQPLDPAQTDNDFGEFIFAPYADYVAHYGQNLEDVDFSLDALREITMRFSGEDAIRYFINQHPQKTFNKIKQWAKDKHYHVRRLCSEGLRPKLPWCVKIKFPYQQALPILTQLHADKTRYVTRSIANHLNDISKINPQAVLQILAEWRTLKKQTHQELDYMTKHALRTLIKKGHAPTMNFIGLATHPLVSVKNFSLSQPVYRLGESLQFSFDVYAQKDESVLIDYRIEFPSLAQKIRQKVFKFKKINLQKDEKITLCKNHLLKANMTTFKIHSGRHHLILQVNGQDRARLEFEVIA